MSCNCKVCRRGRKFEEMKKDLPEKWHPFIHEVRLDLEAAETDLAFCEVKLAKQSKHLNDIKAGATTDKGGMV